MNRARTWLLGLVWALRLSGMPSLPFPQDPVTAGGDLIGHVRLLKTLGTKVHLEWLYLEDRLDQAPEQKALVQGGGALEFAPGLLYHGRDGLDEALLGGRVRGPAYFTRAPHVWAIGAFHEGSLSPAVFVVEALTFNRWQDAGEAVLEAEVDRAAGIIDPYPKAATSFPLADVAEIWTDEETAERYDRLLRTHDRALSAADRRLREAVGPWIADGRLIVLRGLRHGELDRVNFFPAAYELVGRYFVDRGLADRMPAFRARKPAPAQSRRSGDYFRPSR